MKKPPRCWDGVIPWRDFVANPVPGIYRFADKYPVLPCVVDAHGGVDPHADMTRPDAIIFFLIRFKTDRKQRNLLLALTDGHRLAPIANWGSNSYLTPDSAKYELTTGDQVSIKNVITRYLNTNE